MAVLTSTEKLFVTRSQTAIISWRISTIMSLELSFSERRGRVVLWKECAVQKLQRTKMSRNKRIACWQVVWFKTSLHWICQFQNSFKMLEAAIPHKMKTSRNRKSAKHKILYKIFLSLIQGKNYFSSTQQTNEPFGTSIWLGAQVINTARCLYHLRKVLANTCFNWVYKSNNTRYFSA